jgi:hypothetical protein
LKRLPFKALDVSGSHRLFRPAIVPVVEMAGFAWQGFSKPAVEMAGFAKRK